MLAYLTHLLLDWRFYRRRSYAVHVVAEILTNAVQRLGKYHHYTHRFVFIKLQTYPWAQHEATTTVRAFFALMQAYCLISSESISTV